MNNDPINAALALQAKFDSGELSPLDCPVSTRVALDALAAEVRAQRERRCGTCKHQYESEGWIVCRHLQLTCDTMGHTCGAWAAKESA